MNKEVLEEFKETLDELKEYSKMGIPIIVEGQKDEASLREIGITGPIITISGMKLLEIAEMLEKEEIIVLTDFDRRGDKMALTILSYRVGDSTLTKYFRSKIRKLKAHITPCVEGFAKTYLKACRMEKTYKNPFRRLN
ncbi:MAG: toprim domain-containing protein [Candidatus Freyarchaeota archaeon]|nr:toprim domain-containing protein [Candidatus Freyrarchaeum guaymaensis]HDO80750.1 toprim domain-containing protein [Candidatus Bathyarchaeota archaeon]